MRTQNSLASAFKTAQTEILKREEEEGFPPSQPQMRVGNHISLILPLLESHLFPAAGTLVSESAELEQAELSPLEKLSSIQLPKIEKQQPIAPLPQ